MAKIGRNAPCPCGSGKKYKKCCLPKARQKHWTFEEIHSFPTEEILSKLGEFGIEITEEGFPREVENFYSAEDLAENWWMTYNVTAKGFDQDFPWMAADVLWERLAPHVINSRKLAGGTCTKTWVITIKRRAFTGWHWIETLPAKKMSWRGC